MSRDATWSKSGCHVTEQHKTKTETLGGVRQVTEYVRYVRIDHYRQITVGNSCPDAAFPSAMALNAAPAVGTVTNRAVSRNPVSNEIITVEEEVGAVLAGAGADEDGWVFQASHIINGE